MRAWRELTLADLVAEAGGDIQTGPFGSQLHAADYVLDGTPSVMPQNIGDNRIEPTGIARVAPEDMDRLRRYWLTPGDIVYSRRGDVERRALVRPENDGWLCGTGCLRVRIANQDLHDPTFVSYALGEPATRAWITRHAVGATMLNLNTSILGAVPLRIPMIDEQRGIAEVLGALDDKIAANEQVAATADEWVRANFEHLGAASDHRRRVADLATNIRRSTQPAEIAETDVYLGLEHMPRRKMWMGERGDGSGLASAKFAFERGDTLFGKLRPYFHKVVRADAHGVCSTDILVVRAKSRELSGYLHAAVASDPVVAACVAASEGTRMPRTSWKDLASVEVPFPGDAEARRFSASVNTLAEWVAAAARENRHLTEVRDTLLPALMSGRVRVKDAEVTVSGVV